MDYDVTTILYHNKNDNNGLVVTAPEKFYLDESEEIPDYLIAVATRREGYTQYPVTPIKAINWYMSFERPEIEEMRADFNATTDNGALHPRVIATKEDFDRIRALKDTDETMRLMVDQILKNADAYLELPPREYNIPDKQRLLDASREYLLRLLPLAFAWQVTGEQKYADKVWEMFETALNYPDWNPSHMIDTGEMVGAIGAAYDWCYDYFTPEQRQWIYERVKVLGLKPIADAQKDMITTRYEWAGANDFVASKSNFNTVINGGELTGLCAFIEMEPDYLLDVMKETLRSIEYSTLVWRPAGLWIESSSYWDYAAKYFTKGLGSVLNTMGQHYGLLDGQGLDRTGTWIRGMASYGGLNNFHDAGAGKLASPYPGWFARIYDQPALAASTINQIVRGERTATPEDAFWYIPNNPAKEDDLPLDIWTAGFDSVSSHASYTDNDALFFSTHGGKVVCYHSQYDVGTFVLDLMGTRWVNDLGSDDYNVRRDNDGFNKMYRDIAEGHSVMVFNNGVPGQHKDGCAVMTRWETKDKGCIASYDMTTVYQDDVTAAERGFYVGDNRRSLTVRDEFTANKAMPAHWFVQTSAEVEIADNNTAILTKGGKKLKMEVVTDVADYQLTVGDARPLPTSPDIKGQNQNIGYKRIDIQMNLIANQPQHVTVKFSPYSEATEDINKMNIPIAQWQIPDGEFIPREAMNARILVNGRNMDEIATNGKIGIVEGEAMPEITAIPENPNQTVEIIPGDPPTAYTTVRVYSSDRSIYNEFYVEYTMSSSADMSSYQQLDIEDFNVSSTPEPENHKENMFDNDFSTRWTSANQAGEWAVFDLGTPQDIDAVGMAFWRGNTRKYMYEILVSNDGENWTSVASGTSSGSTEGMETVEFARTNARYVKFLGGGNTDNGHSNILEFSILRKK